ncbi:hypothetical protein HK104_006229 [Borealophlyctis nickersoniae]|nr:hypothetical protein HK104_006229 [Borealophlyctis nickersoniae]
MQSSTSQGFATHDGIPVMADRAAEEVVQWVSEEVIPSLKRLGASDDDGTPAAGEEIKSGRRRRYKLFLSIVGHSLGGLIARYVIKLLLDPSTPTPTAHHLSPLIAAHSDVITALEPLTFLTICTPHFGSRRAARPNSWVGLTFQGIVRFYLKSIAGLTGKQLYLIDGAGTTVEGEHVLPAFEIPDTTNPELISPKSKDDTPSAWSEDESIPLLMRMADPRSPYSQALSLFRPILVSAVRNDVPVGYCSAAISSVHPHPEILPGGGEVGAVVENGGTAAAAGTGKDAGSEMRIMSFSGFGTFGEGGDVSVGAEVRRKIHGGPNDVEDEMRGFYVDTLFSAGDDDPAEIKHIRYDTAVEIGSPKGTKHHLGEPFHAVEDIAGHARDSSDSPPKPPPFLPDMQHDNIIPTSVLLSLQASPLGKARRINIDFALRNPLTRATVHALAVGKGELSLFNPESAWLAKQAGYFLARIVLVDFLWKLREERGV